MKHNTLTTTFDLTVIGGGIIGAWTLHLAKTMFPDWNILLLDANLVGNGASRYSASLDMPGGHTPLRKRLVKSSQENWGKLLSNDSTLPIRGIDAYGISKKEELASIRGHFSGLINEEGDHEGYLKKLQSFLPGMDVTSDHSLFQVPFAQYAFQNTIAEQLISNLRREEKCTVIEGFEVTSVSTAEDDLTLTSVTGISINTKRVVEATGPWMLTGPMADKCVSLGARTKKIVALHIEKEPHPNAPVVYSFDKDAFLMPRHEAGQWLFSFRREAWDVFPNLDDLKINSGDLLAAKKVLNTLYSPFSRLISGGRSFCDTYGQNNDPIIETISEKGNYVIAGGGSGSGFRLAPGIALEALSLLK
ncbi:MAG: NAD(P)/FAD-dependent oxidoreductase [Crocinitomicaceae bacterium]